MPNNEKHRPPHGKYKINEMIKLNLIDEAQAACDENVEWYEAKADLYRHLYVEAQMARMGVKSMKPKEETT